MPEPAVIYIDLIKDEPMTRGEWIIENPSRDPDYIETGYKQYLDRFQPWRWNAKREGNFEVMARGESYFNEADARHAIDELFAAGSNVYLRQHEKGNEPLRMAT